jgi:hypothetical protein
MMFLNEPFVCRLVCDDAASMQVKVLLVPLVLINHKGNNFQSDLYKSVFCNLLSVFFIQVIAYTVLFTSVMR